MQRHSLTSIETARSLANDPSWGGGVEGEVYILRSPWIAVSPISLLSMGEVCGRSLTAMKILFTGRQTCTLYLVLYDSAGRRNTLRFTLGHLDYKVRWEWIEFQICKYYLNRSTICMKLVYLLRTNLWAHYKIL